MDDLSSKWTLELEKSSNTFLKSPLSFQRPFDLHKTPHLDSFESSFFMSEFLPKPALHSLDAYEILSDHKGDSFLLEPSSHLNVEPPQEGQNEENAVQLDISIGNTHLLMPPDYDLDCYQIRRSRGPSFDMGCEKGGGEEIYSTDLNFARLFNDHGAHILSRISGATDLIECPQNTMNLEENISIAQNPDDMDPIDDVLSPQDIQKDASSLKTERSLYESYTPKSSCPSENSFSTTEDLALAKRKQRKKSCNSITKRASKVVRKIQKAEKPKKEAKQPKIRSLTSKAHSLSLKLVKVADADHSTATTTCPSDSLLTKQVSCKSQSTASPSKEFTVKEESTEQSTTQDKKLVKVIGARCNPDKAATILSISQSLREQKLEDLDGLFQGLDLPPEVHDFISKSKLFTKTPLLGVRKIGSLTIEERRTKVERYLQKRKDRTWTKKINYDCRKKVADTRLRFKGRFVTRSQVFTMFEEEGIHLDPSRTTEDEIKTILEERFGHDMEKPRIRERDDSDRGERIEKRIKKKAIIVTKKE